MTNNDKVFNEYTPFRNYLRHVRLIESLMAIHAHMQFMQFSVPLPPHIIGTPDGYKSSKTLKDFLNFGLFPWDLEIITKEVIINSPIYGENKSFQNWYFLSHAINKLKNLENQIVKIYIDTPNVLR